MTTVEDRQTDFPYGRDVDAEFDAFYRETVVGVFRFMYRLSANWHLSEEVTQETYVKMFQRWAQRRIHSREQNRRFTVATAHHSLIDKFRSARRYTGGALPDVGVEDVNIAVVDISDTIAIIRGFLATQPVTRQAVGYLYIVEQRDTDEVAETLGISRSTVRTHVQRLRELLQPLLAHLRDGGDGHDRP